MTDSPLVSVVIAARNVERYVAAAVRSALDQTHGRLEVIVVDDASTDATPRVLDALAEDDPRLRVRHRSERSGPAAARNEGIGHAEGDLVCFLDADDLYRPDRVTDQVAHLEAHAEQGAVYSDYEVVDADLRPLRRRELGRPPGDLLDSLLLFNFFQIGAVLVRREAVDAVRGFNERVRLAEDWDLWIRLARATTIGYRPGVVVDYRLHPGQRTGDLALKRRNYRSILAEQRNLSRDQRRRLTTGVYWSLAQLEWGQGSKVRSVGALARVAAAARTPARVRQVRDLASYRSGRSDRASAS